MGNPQVHIYVRILRRVPAKRPRKRNYPVT